MSTENKKSKWGIVAIVICVLSVIGIMAQEGFKPEPHTEPTKIDIPTLPDPGPVRILNPEYRSLIEKYDGDVNGDKAPSGLNSQSVAKEIEDGLLKVITLNYDDEKAVEWKITLYKDLSEYSPESADEYEEIVRKNYGEMFGSIDCVEVNYKRVNTFLVITIYMKDLDDLSNVKKLKESGAITMEDEDSYISVEETVDGYLSEGYTEKYIVR